MGQPWSHCFCLYCVTVAGKTVFTLFCPSDSNVNLESRSVSHLCHTCADQNRTNSLLFWCEGRILDIFIHFLYMDLTKCLNTPTRNRLESRPFNGLFHPIGAWIVLDAHCSMWADSHKRTATLKCSSKPIFNGSYYLLQCNQYTFHNFISPPFLCRALSLPL